MFALAPIVTVPCAAPSITATRRTSRTGQGLFYQAESFNQDISGWDISSATAADGMFYGARSFNQDLCAWADAWPYDGVPAGDDDAWYGLPTFGGSGCAFEGDPGPEGGPFCASNCLAPQPGEGEETNGINDFEVHSGKMAPRSLRRSIFVVGFLLILAL